MRAIWSLILLLTVNTLYVQPDLKTRLDAFFASQPATTPGFALSIQKKDSLIYRNATGLADITSGVPLDSRSSPPFAASAYPSETEHSMQWVGLSTLIPRPSSSTPAAPAASTIS
jgi:hypothetical protein